MIKLVLRVILILIVWWCIGLAGYISWIYTLKPYGGEAEGIVVFTGGDKRVAVGLELLAENKADYMLISGVNASVTKAEILALGAQDKKLNKALLKKIDLGFAAQNTLGNADEAAKWVLQKKIQSIIVVTSHYHMPRAMLHLGAELPDVALYPYPVRSKLFDDMAIWRHVTLWRPLVSDYNKLLFTYPQMLINRVS